MSPASTTRNKPLPPRSFSSISRWSFFGLELEKFVTESNADRCPDGQEHGNVTGQDDMVPKGVQFAPRRSVDSTHYDVDITEIGAQTAVDGWEGDKFQRQEDNMVPPFALPPKERERGMRYARRKSEWSTYDDGNIPQSGGRTNTDERDFNMDLTVTLPPKKPEAGMQYAPEDVLRRTWSLNDDDDSEFCPDRCLWPNWQKLFDFKVIRERLKARNVAAVEPTPCRKQSLSTRFEPGGMNFLR